MLASIAPNKLTLHFFKVWLLLSNKSVSKNATQKWISSCCTYILHFEIKSMYSKRIQNAISLVEFLVLFWTRKNIRIVCQKDHPIFSQFLYLYQPLVIQIPENFFSKMLKAWIDDNFLHFIWWWLNMFLPIFVFGRKVLRIIDLYFLSPILQNRPMSLFGRSLLPPEWVMSFMDSPKLLMCSH